MLKTYTGSCHCGRVKYRAEIDLAAGAGRCNCSYCSKIRNWSATIKPERFELLTGADDLSDYQFASRAVHHRFCRHCGVRLFSDGFVEAIGGGRDARGGAIVIIRRADQQQVRPDGVDFTIDRVPVGAARRAEDRPSRRCSAGDGVAGGNADAAQSEVEGQDDPRAPRHVRRGRRTG